MTTQTVQIHTFDYGASLSSATLRSIADDTLVATADSVNEVTTDSGLYAAVFGEPSVIAAGTYRLRAVISGQPINRYVTLAGTDNEVVQARSERLAVLDSATITKIDEIKAVTDKVDTGLVADGLVYQFTANMLELGPSGGGGGDATEANQLIIIDKIDTYASSALATVNGTSGTIVGFPSALNVGDSYTDEADSAIHVFIRDANDDPITSVGDFEFTDTTFAPKLIITQSGTTSRVKATVSYVDPGVAESYLKVQIPSSESRRVSPGVATMQCILQWVDTEGKVLCQKTLAKQAVTWNEMI